MLLFASCTKEWKERMRMRPRRAVRIEERAVDLEGRAEGIVVGRFEGREVEVDGLLVVASEEDSPQAQSLHQQG